LTIERGGPRPEYHLAVSTRSDSAYWDAIYASGEYRQHWDYAHPSPELVAIVAAGLALPGGTALDLGCGAGREALGTHEGAIRHRWWHLRAASATSRRAAPTVSVTAPPASSTTTGIPEPSSLARAAGSRARTAVITASRDGQPAARSARVGSARTGEAASRSRPAATRARRTEVDRRADAPCGWLMG
jgi:hypothetical protein